MREEFIIYNKEVVNFMAWASAETYTRNRDLLTFKNVTVDTLVSGIRLLQDHDLSTYTANVYKIKEVYLW